MCTLLLVKLRDELLEGIVELDLGVEVRINAETLLDLIVKLRVLCLHLYLLRGVVLVARILAMSDLILQSLRNWPLVHDYHV